MSLLESNDLMGNVYGNLNHFKCIFFEVIFAILSAISVKDKERNLANEW